MSPRGRAVGFASAAAICAGLAAGATGGGPGTEDRYGELRDVVVAAAALERGTALGREAVRASLAVRRVPESFAPPDALTSPAQALGHRPAVPIPAGGYLLASQLATPGARDRDRNQRLGSGRRPVELTVAGAAALAAAGGGGRVDVVVTSEGSVGGGAGRTYVAAARVRLLDLRPAGGEPAVGPPTAISGEAWIATLALTRAQALRLIHAESFARDVRLIGA